MGLLSPHKQKLKNESVDTKKLKPYYIIDSIINAIIVK